jgi:hypothetical protein
MATLPQAKVADPKQKTTPAEDALCDAFEGLVETLPPKTRKGLLSDLRANAHAHGE